MTSWVKEVPLAQLEEGKDYFLARKWVSECAGTSYQFLSRLLSGKQQWTVKPGIAIRCSDIDKLRSVIGENKSLVAIAIPADADQRWKARKRRS